MTAAPLAAQWRDLLAALAHGEKGPGEALQRCALAAVLGDLQALRQEPPPHVVVVIDEISALAEEACGPLWRCRARSPAGGGRCWPRRHCPAPRAPYPGYTGLHLRAYLLVYPGRRWRPYLGPVPGSQPVPGMATRSGRSAVPGPWSGSP